MTCYEQNTLGTVNCTDEHMIAEQILFTLKKKFPAMVMAAVYNNLNSLYQKEMIRKISVEGQPDRYDKNTGHDHLVRRRCEKLVDPNLSDMTAELEKQVGFKIDVYDLKIYYLCPECCRA